MKSETLACVPGAAVRPISARRRAFRAAAGVLTFTLLTALGAQIVIPVPGSPVPITLQTLFVLLAGVTLGPRLGLASMALYVLLGSAGVPVFAAAVWKQGVFFGPTGGYLIGFVLAQPVMGRLARQRFGNPPETKSGSPPDRTGFLSSHWPGVLLAVIAGNFVIFGTGLIWLGLWTGANLAATLAMGLWPFVAGIVFKSGLACAAGGATLPLWRRAVERPAV